MDFKDLRKDSIIYIFDRNGDMDIIVTKAMSDASTSHIDYQNASGSRMQMVVDVNIEVNGVTKMYVVPDNASATITPDNWVISTDISPIIRELEAIRDRNYEIVKSAPDCEKKAKRCETLLEQHSPELRKHKEDERRFRSIEDGMSSLRNDVNSKFDLILKRLNNK